MFGPKSVNQILAGFSKTLDELETFMVQADATQKANDQRIRELQAENAAVHADALRAQNAADKIKEIIG